LGQGALVDSEVLARLYLHLVQKIPALPASVVQYELEKALNKAD
jgi:hypothetical protein